MPLSYGKVEHDSMHGELSLLLCIDVDILSSENSSVAVRMRIDMHSQCFQRSVSPYDDSFVEQKSARFCGQSVAKYTCRPGDARLAQDGEKGVHVVLAHSCCETCVLCHSRVL